MKMSQKVKSRLDAHSKFVIKGPVCDIVARVVDVESRFVADRTERMNVFQIEYQQVSSIEYPEISAIMEYVPLRSKYKIGTRQSELALVQTDR